MGAGPLQATAKLARDLDVAQETIESSPEMQGQARMAIIAKRFKPILEDVGTPDLLSGMATTKARLSEDQIKSARDSIEKKQRELRHPIEWRGSPVGGVEAHDVAPSERGLAQADQLQLVIKALNDLLEETKRGNANKPQPRPTLGRPDQRN
jgi:hypothetical protein